MFNFEWIILRLTALFIFFSFLIDVEIFILIFGFLILHISLGLRTIIFDYIHVKKVKLISFTLIRISLMEITRYILELLV